MKVLNQQQYKDNLLKGNFLLLVNMTNLTKPGSSTGYHLFG